MQNLANPSGTLVQKSLGAFSESKAPQNVFQRFIKKDENKNFVKKIFVKPRIFGGSDVVTYVS